MSLPVPVLVNDAYRCCHLCEHRCGVDRTCGAAGLCHADDVARVFQYGVEYGEERELLPCQVVYLSGCDLRCVFCISGRQSFDAGCGRPLTGELLKEILLDAGEQGARTLQFSGGEPSIHVPELLPLLGEIGLPIVWKTALHETVETLEMLLPHVDVFVADLKFGSDACALRLARVPGYLAIARRNLLWLASRGKRVIVRHLVLPNHHECCVEPTLRWLADEAAELPVSLRDGYVAEWRAGAVEDIGRAVSLAEVTRARQVAGRLGLKVIR